MWVKTKGKEIPYLNLIRSCASIEAPESAAEAVHQQKYFHDLSIFNPRGVEIFGLRGIGGFGMMDDPRGAGYGVFHVFDRWITSNTCSRYYVRPGVSALLAFSESGKGDALGRSRRLVRGRTSRYSLTVLTEDGQDLEPFRRIGFDIWLFRQELRGGKFEPFISLEYFGRKGIPVATERIWPGAFSTLIFETVIDIPAKK